MQYIFGTKIAPQKLPEIQNIETADVVEVTKQMFKYYLRSIVIKTTELSNFILLNIGKPIIYWKEKKYSHFFVILLIVIRCMHSWEKWFTKSK